MFSVIVASFFALFLPTGTGSPAQSVDDVVAAVSKNVEQFQNQLPDFVCNERITSSTFESGKVRERRTVEAVFSESRKRGEQRDIRAIDETPAKKNAKMPPLPAYFDVGFSGLLVTAFSPVILRMHNYSLDPKPGEPGRILLQFETRRDQNDLQWTLNGDKRVVRDTGNVWIDSASMQVSHLERHFLNLPRSLARLVITSDYGPVTIDEKQFWLPKTFQAEGENPIRNKTLTFLYTAEYADCQKFTADIRLVPR
jgi:hypothetical protein